MSFHFVDLDSVTRQHMEAEFDRDSATGSLYLSPRLSVTGAMVWPSLLQDAIRSGSDATLAKALSTPGVLSSTELSQRNGVQHTKRVPVNAAAILGEGEFNRFYLRGLAARAVAESRIIEIYRGRPSAAPRADSVALEGSTVDPGLLLADLRARIGLDTFLGLPSGPNSGLTGRLST